MKTKFFISTYLVYLANVKCQNIFLLAFKDRILMNSVKITKIYKLLCSLKFVKFLEFNTRFPYLSLFLEIKKKFNLTLQIFVMIY